MAASTHFIVTEIACIDQRTDGHLSREGVSESCGIHALRNAMIFLQFCELPTAERTPILFNTVDFEKFYQKCIMEVQETQKGGKDITLPVQRHLIHKLMLGKLSPETASASVALTTIAALQNLPVLSAAPMLIQPGKPGELSLLGGELNLDCLSNLHLIAQRIGKAGQPFTHAFLIGVNNEHWVTIVLEQNAKGTYSWFGMDSLAEWSGQSRFLKGVVLGLEKAVRDAKNIDNFYKLFSECAKQGLKQYDKTFTEGKLKSERITIHTHVGEKSCSASEYLLSKDTYENLVNTLKNIFQFLENNKLWTVPQFKSDVMKLQCLLEFYAINLPASTLKTSFVEMNKRITQVSKMTSSSSSTPTPAPKPVLFRTEERKEKKEERVLPLPASPAPLLPPKAVIAPAGLIPRAAEAPAPAAGGGPIVPLTPEKLAELIKNLKKRTT